LSSACAAKVLQNNNGKMALRMTGYLIGFFGLTASCRPNCFG